MTYVFEECIAGVLISCGAAEASVLGCIWKTPFRSRRVPTRCNATFPIGSSTLFGKIDQLPFSGSRDRYTPALHDGVELTNCMLSLLLENTLFVTTMVIESHFVCPFSETRFHGKCGSNTGCAELDSAFWAQRHTGH